MFFVGDKVYISEDSEYYGEDSRYNPADMVGEVTDDEYDEDYDGHCYYVVWSNGKGNCYREEDLILVASRSTNIEVV